MNNFKSSLFLVIILLFANYSNAQDYLMALNASSLNFIAKEFKGEPLIKNKTFTFQNNGEKVEVFFTENMHYEFYKNKKYFIKSKLFWVSRNIAYIIIEDFTLPDCILKKGEKIKMEITKIDKEYMHYKSTLAGKTWLGKMKEINN